MKQLFRRNKQTKVPHKLTVEEIDAILRNGIIGADEPFQAWIDRAHQFPMPDLISKFAGYLNKIGLTDLQWLQAKRWQKDERVFVTHLVASVAAKSVKLGSELEGASHCYELTWLDRWKTSGAPEIWFEYHSANEEYRPGVLQTLEEARIGDISYPNWLNLISASTDVGIVSTLLTGIGALRIRNASNSMTGKDKWSGFLVIDLPAGELASNPNMPPHYTAQFIASMLRNPYTYFYNKTELWVPFQVDIPQDEKGKSRLLEVQQGEKRWW